MTKPWQSFNFYFSSTATHRPLIAVSACLNGEAVRYDGTDKYLASLTTLKQDATLVSICPEVGAGMSIPRPPIQLQTVNNRTADHHIPDRQIIENDIVAIGRDDPTLDMTQPLHEFAARSITPISQQLCGYIFKARSPSCGVNSTPLHDQHGKLVGTTSGIQAAYIQQFLPWLPLREEHQLPLGDSCQHFILQCLILFDLRCSSEQNRLAAAIQHYRSLIEKFDLEAQQTLRRIENQQPLCKDTYLAMFSRSLTDLSLAEIIGQK